VKSFLDGQNEFPSQFHCLTLVKKLTYRYCKTYFAVYCPFPGYIENGRVMLVGNMGVYDYRPYVRKVTNNKQIMYECNRGYVLADGPPGATCIGGRWSPKQLPR
jgi:hypothetical protein